MLTVARRAINGDCRLMIICLSPHAGGMELDALRMLLRLNFHFETVFVCRVGTFIYQKALSCGVKIQGIKASGWASTKVISFRLIFTLRALIKNTKSSHIIFFGTSELRSITLASHGLDIQIYMRHGTTVGTKKFGVWWREFGYRRVNAYIANSEHIANNIKCFFPVSQNASIRVVYPVISFSAIGAVQHSLEPSNLGIIYHSRFVRGKGHADAIVAIAALVKAGYEVSYKMIGEFSDLDYVRELEQLIRTLRLEGICEIFSFDESIQEKLSSSVIFLGPSYGEGFSNSFVEALSSGLICIVYNNTVYPECGRLGFEFVMAKDRDIEDLSEKLLMVVKSLGSYRMGAGKNIRLAKSLFSAERELEDIRGLLDCN